MLEREERGEREREREREMVGCMFLSWGRPTPEQQKCCIANSGSFNYDPAFYGASSSPKPHQETGKQEDSNEALLSRNGFSINRARVLLGSGPKTFTLAKSALLSWRQFRLGWAFVDPKTPVEAGARFCVCVKELLPWIMMPLQVAYVIDSSSSSHGAAASDHRIKASFAFGSGTLRGHLLAGEERFSIEWDENDRVWYEIFSFSKPAHFLSVVGYPYVQLRQKYFAHQSARSVLKHVAAQQSTTQ